MSGVWAGKGGSIRLVGLSFDALTGEPIGSPQVEMTTEVWPHWLAIAHTHNALAEQARSDLVAAHAVGDDEAKSRALENEFRNSMVALTSAAVAVESFYESVRERIELPDHLEQTWRENRTPKTRRMREVFKRGFAVGPNSLDEMETRLKELFRFRNWAVHPPAAFRPVVLHPALEQGVEWRYAAFRVENSLASEQLTRSVLSGLLALPKESAAAVRDWALAVTPLIVSDAD